MIILASGSVLKFYLVFLKISFVHIDIPPIILFNWFFVILKFIFKENGIIINEKLVSFARNNLKINTMKTK